MNKKIIAVLMAVLLAVSLYAGGRRDSGDGRVEITYMIWANENEAATAQQVLDTYNASQDHTRVLLSYVPEAEYITKVNALAAAGQLPDVIKGREAVVLEWAVNGIIADVSQMYAGRSAPLDSLAFRYQGKPVAYSSANEVLLLYYNRDLFDAAGIPYPPARAEDAWTWDEFVAVAKRLTKDTNGRTADQAGFDPNSIAAYGVWFDTLGWMWPIMAVSNGGGLISQDGREFLMDRPESIEAAQAVADLYLKHHVSPAPGAALPTIEVTLLSGQVAMATGGQWNIGTNFPNAPGLNYGVAVLPKFKTPVTYNTGGPECISATTKYPQEAMDFLKWYTEETNNWALIETGVWMPIIEDWYTDESLTRRWADNPNHPPYAEYKSAVVDYALNNAVQVPWYFHPAYQRIEDVLNTAMGDVWLGRKTAQQAITEAAPRMRQIFAEQ